MASFKRFMSLVLAMVMVVGTLPPIGVKAEEVDAVETVSLQETTAETASGEHTETENIQPAAIEVTEMTEPTAATTETPEEEWTAAAKVSETAVSASSGTCGSSLRWELNDEGTLVVSGSGDMYAYSYSGSYGTAPWESCKRDIKKIVIEDGVTSIGKCAFWSVPNLTEVHIGDGVTYIGEQAFSECRNVKAIYIGTGLQTVDQLAFFGCDALRSVYAADLASWCKIDFNAYYGNPIASVSVYENGAWVEHDVALYADGVAVTGELVIPEGVTRIGNGTFVDCIGVTSVVLPEGLTEISGSFGGCLSLSSVSFPKSLKSIRGFVECGFTQVSIPEWVTEIDGSAFAYCAQLTEVTIPASVVNIGDSAFANCTVLADIEIPASVKSIGASAFSGCKALTEIMIPDSVTDLGSDAFAYCSELRSVTLPSSLTEISAGLFNGCSALQSVSVPVGATSIGSRAFFGCSSLKMAALPESLTSIGDEAFRNISAITDMRLPDSITSIGAYEFAGLTNWKDASIPASVESVGNYAYRGCIFLTEVKLPDCLVNVGSYAFQDCTGVKSVSVSSGMQGISEGMFQGCSGIDTVSLPASITAISRNAFKNCGTISRVDFLGDAPSIDGTAFSGVTATCYYPEGNDSYTAEITTSEYGGNLLWTFEGEESDDSFKCGDNVKWALSETGVLTISGSGEMYDYSVADYHFAPWYEQRSAVTEIRIEMGVTTIGEAVFYGCTGARTVTMPDTVTSIGAMAFYGVPAPSIDLSDALTDIGDQAFCNSGLTSIILPEGVKNVGTDVFKSSRLTSAVLPDSLTYIPAGMFTSCFYLVTVDLPEYITYIGKKAFASCAGLSSLVLPEGLISIGDNAFSACGSYTIYSGVYPCSNFSSITLPSTLQSIGGMAFSWCERLRTIEIPDGVKTIGSGAFYQCKLTSISVSSGIEEIEKDAFDMCTKLSTVIFRWGAPTIGSNAFSDVKATCYYPSNNAAWTADLLQHYGGNLTWVAQEMLPPAGEDGGNSEAPGENEDSGETGEGGDSGNEGAEGGGSDEGNNAGGSGGGENGGNTGSGQNPGQGTCDSGVHSLGARIVVKAPTCTEDGEIRYDCTLCDYYEIQVEKALGHTYSTVVTDLACTVCGQMNDFEGHLQQLPESFCGGVNLWLLLNHDTDYYYAGTHWGQLDDVRSVTIPVESGDRLVATSFAKGIRVAYFDNSGLVVSLSDSEVRKEFTQNGYLTVPEGVAAANIPMWDNSEANELYIRNRPHSYENDSCTLCKHERLRVIAEDMAQTVGGVYVADGTYNASYTNNWFADIPIPQGAEQVRILTFKTGAGCGSVFLGAGKYISGYADTEKGGQWVTLDIPAGADTFRYCYVNDAVAQNAGIPLFQYMEFYGWELGPLEKPPFAYRPATGCHSFRVDVNIAPAMGNPDGYVSGADYGYIQLPTNYNPYGQPTRLIIVCHGAGATLSNYQSDSWKTTNYSFWTDLGYAVMDMYACPQELTGNDDCLHYGNPVVLECYKKGYEYVMENFNLKRDGIYVIGSSMGGLSSFQIAQSGQFPVIAQVGYCPAIDLFKQAYCNPWATASYQRSRIASYFGFTGTQPTFTDSKYPSAAEIDFYRQNFDKTVEYSPILHNVTAGDVTSILNVAPTSAAATDAAEAALYDQLTATHPCPLLIFHNTDDGVVSYRYSQYFVDMVNRSGQDAKLYTFTSGGHNAWANGESVTVTGINGQITIKESQYEAYRFFEKYEQHDEHQSWVDPAVKATCSTTGLTEGKHCASCGEILVEQNEIPATGEHNYENGICTGCGEKAPELAGKTISILGASVSTYEGTSNGAAANTTNSTIANNVKYYPNTTIPEVTLNDTWWMQVASDLDLRLLVNNAWSGSAILLERSGTVGAYVDRCVQLHDDTGDNAGEEPDIICIQMGFNDFSYGKGTLGTADIDYDTLITADGYGTPATTMEATAIMLDKIAKRYPDAEVYMFNHFKRIGQSAADTALMEQLNADIAQVCGRFGVTVVDLYTTLTDAGHIGDGRLHPNRLGMDVITEAVKTAILANTAYTVESHRVTFALEGVTADYGTDKQVVAGAAFMVSLAAPEGDQLDVTVTMGGEDITAGAYADGTVTIDAVTADVTVTAKSVHTPAAYRWEFDGTDLACVYGENALTKTAGSTTDGVFSTTRYTMEKPVVLSHTEPWVVEWRCEGTWKNTSGNGGRMFTTTPVNAQYNARYIFKSSTNGLIAMGEKTATGSHNYGIALGDHGIDWTAPLTYRLENRIADDGSNMIYLLVDGEEIGPMVNYFVGTASQNTTSDWLDGKDFTFGYMGTDSHGLNNCSVDYIQIWEGGETAEPMSLRYDDHVDITGKTVQVVNAGKPTSYQVGYGVAEGALDAAVVAVEGDCLVATGIGTALVRLDGQLYEVTVTAAPISLLLLIGQSNMRGSEGDAGQSIVCPDGMVYATFGDDRGDAEGIMNVNNATKFAASALTGPYSTVNVEGTTENLSYYPINSLTAEGAGTFGPDSGFAYEWVKQTGEKVWVVNASHGGSAIATWQPNATNFKECDLLFSACQETLRKEIAAGHYALSHMGYFWCQGCSDATMTAKQYVQKYLTMHEALKTALAFDHDSDVSTPNISLEFGGIIPVRAGRESFVSYREGTYTDTTTKSYYESFKDLRFTGPRVAQYWMANNPELPDIWNVCNIGESWVWMPDGTNGVSAYFQTHYPDGMVNYTTQVAQKASWYTPTTPKAVHDTIHYNQIGYNEVGREAARNALILLGESEAPDVETTVKFLSWDGYSEVSVIDASTEGKSTTLVVPVVYPLWKSKEVSYTLSDGLTWNYYDLLAADDSVDGTVFCATGNKSVAVVGHRWSAWETLSEPSPEGAGKQQRTCADCGETETKSVDGVWQIYDLSAHLLELPEFICCDTNLWARLPHEDVHFTSGKTWGNATTPVTSITIPVNPGDRMYATSWNKAGVNGHATANGIRVTFFDSYGIAKTMGPGQTDKEFLANGGFLEAPEGAIAINIAMWYDSQDYEVYILNREHSYETVVTAPDCTEDGYSTHTCRACGQSYVSDEVAALGHTEVVDAAVAPDCVNTGLTEGKHCSVCEEILVAQEEVPALGHTEVIDETVAPTCTETGLTEGKHCSVCNEILVKQELVPALGHTEVVDAAVAPTCTETGLTEGKHCSRCKVVLVKQEAVAAAGHIPGKAETCTTNQICTVCKVELTPAKGHTEVIDEAVAPTCTETGLTEGKHCSVCNEILVKQEIVPALGHTEVVDAAVAPTCTETGLTEGKHCSVCNEVLVKQEVVPALGHTEVIDAAVAPTCTETGLTEGKHCSVCNKILVKQEIVPALGHTEVIAAAVAPDCVNTGLTEGKHCSVCNEILVKQEIVPALGHTEVVDAAVAPDCVNTGLTEGKHCSVCNTVLVKQEVVPALGHTEGAEATCTTAQVCTVCGDELKAALGHDMIRDNEVPATCTTPGHQSGAHCSRCDYTEGGGEIPALGHTEVIDAAVAPDCVNTGLTEGKHCSVCNEVLVKQEVVPALGHTEVVDAAVAPDCTNTGLTEGKHCSVCNEVLVKQEVVPALGHSFEMQEDQIICSACGGELKLSVAQDYVALEVGQTFELDVSPAEFAEQIEWSIDGDDGVITMAGNIVTAAAAGTVYVNAAVREGAFESAVRFRVDVANAMELEGVQLSTTKVTTELYKTEYTTLDILLKLPQNYSAQADNAAVENRGVAIESAKFTDDGIGKLFDLVVLDDRTVRIVPTEEALANAKAVKGSYSGTVTVTVDGEPYETEKLTLSVKKTLPKLKASVAAFNSFYAGQSQPITITGATVTGISLDSGKKQPEWLNLEDGMLVLNEKAPAKSASGKVYLLVETAEWTVPAALTLTVKNTYKVPGVKLATSSITVSNQSGAAVVELKLVCTNKADTISGIGITGITAPEGYAVENFNEETGTFTLKAAEGFKAGKIELRVTFGTVTHTLKLTVKTQTVKLKLGRTKVSLNKDLGDAATVAVNCLTAGYDVTAPVLTYDAQMLNVQYTDGKLTVSAKAAAYGKTYPVTISAYQDAPAVKLNVAILKQNVAVKSTIKATGFIDVIRDSSAITVTPTYTNVLNVDVDNAAVLKIYSSADKFKAAIAEVKAEDGIFTIDKSVISDQTLKYKAQLETQIDENTVKSKLISLTVKMGKARLTVKTEDTTLFAKDKNDRALVWFASADAALNSVAKVEFKNAKQAAMFELIDYGDGTYAIGFKDGQVDKSLIGKSVTVNLNVFVEGNQTAKANATANVKLTIVK